MTITVVRPRVGDVIKYKSERESRHCREQVAILCEYRDGTQYWRDTFWGIQSQDDHILTQDEIATAEHVFNINDCDELDRYAPGSPISWAKYAPRDRYSIPSQHGLQHRWFVRKGAQPDHETQIENARRELDDRIREAESASRRVEWAREDLDRVIRGER